MATDTGPVILIESGKINALVWTLRIVDRFDTSVMYEPRIYDWADALILFLQRHEGHLARIQTSVLILIPPDLRTFGRSKKTSNESVSAISDLSCSFLKTESNTLS